MNDAERDQLRDRLRSDGALLRSLVDRRVKLKKVGHDWKGRCPFHSEKTASFTVYDGVDVHYHCFGCKAHGDVFDYVMKTEGVDFPEALRRVAEAAGTPLPDKPKPDKPRPSDNGAWEPMVPPPLDAPKPTHAQLRCDMLHEYCAPDDHILFYVKRSETNGQKGKYFVPLTYGRLNGKLGWHQKAPNIPRPLYGLNRPSHGRLDATVMLCEGEKAADAAQRLFPDLIAMSWMGGTGGVATADYSPLNGRRIVIWPDADTPGIEAAEKLFNLLPLAQVIDTTGLPEGYDAADLERDGCDDPETWLKARLRQPPPQPLGQYTPNKVFILRTTLRSAKDIPQRPWIVPGFLLRRAVTLLFGPPDQGKTLLLVAWTVALTLGHALGSFRPFKPQRVLTILAEEDDDEQELRINAALMAFGATIAQIEPNLHRLIVPDLATLLEVDERSGKVVQTKGWEDVLSVVEKFRPDVLLADPLVELHTAEENDNTKLKAVIGNFRSLSRAFELATLLTHHTRKGELKPGSLELARGASATGGAVRIAYTFMEPTDDDVKRIDIKPNLRRYYARLDRARASQAAPTTGAADWFEKIPYPLDNGNETPALRPWTPPEPVAPDQMGQAKLVSDIEKGCPAAGGEPWSPQLRDTEPRSVRSLLRKHDIGLGAEKATMAALYELGVQTAFFRRRATGRSPQGLRAASRLPHADWLDGEDDANKADDTNTQPKPKCHSRADINQFDAAAVAKNLARLLDKQNAHDRNHHQPQNPSNAPADNDTEDKGT